MTRTQWYDIIRPGAISNILIFIVAIVLWGDFFHSGNEVALGSESYAFNYVSEWLSLNPLISRAIDLVVALQVSFTILRLNEAYSFIKVRTILPSALCVLLTGLLLQPHYLTSGSVVALLLFACIASALALSSNNSQIHTFNIGLMLGLAAMVYPFCLLYLLVFFYFYYNINILSLRTLLSTLTGAFLPLFYGSIGLWLTGQSNIFKNYLNPTTHLQLWIPKMESNEIAFAAVVGIMLVGSLIYVWLTYQKEVLKQRRMFSFFVQMLLFTIAMMLFSRSGFNNLLNTLIFLASIIIGRVFSTTVAESKISLWSFRVLVVAIVAYSIHVLFA